MSRVGHSYLVTGHQASKNVDTDLQLQGGPGGGSGFANQYFAHGFYMVGFSLSRITVVALPIASESSSYIRHFSRPMLDSILGVCYNAAVLV